VAGVRPATARFAKAIRQSHTIATQVDVLVDGDVRHTITTAIGGQVTLDAKAQTRGRLDLQLVDDPYGSLLPLTPTDLLAPYGQELHVKRGVRYPDGTSELIGLGVYRIESPTPQDGPQGRMISVTGYDRSKRIQDARFEEPYQIAQGTNYTEAILEQLLDAWPDMPHPFPTTSRGTPQ